MEEGHQNLTEAPPAPAGQRVIRIDARFFYALVALLGTVGVLIIGFWLGITLGRGAPAGPRQQAIGQQQFSAPQQQLGSQAIPPWVEPEAPAKSRVPADEDVPIGDSPRLVLPDLAKTNYVLDFGDMAPDDLPTSKVVRVANRGTRDLVIQNVQAMCGCTAALVSDPTLAPGQEAEISITHDPRAMKEHGQVGRTINHTVMIQSNDPVAPMVEFTVRANILDE